MRNSTIALIAAIVVIGGYFFSQNFSLVGLENVKFKTRESTGTDYGTGTTTIATNAPPVVRNGKTIRIATFNIQVFGRSKISKPIVLDILARIIRHFDVIAIQEIRAKDQDILPLFVEAINNGGRQYDYVIGPRLGRSSSKEQYAFVFDRASIEVDRQQLFTIDDSRNDLLHREPFVGWFRVRGPPLNQSFTFSLVNIHTDPDEVADEVNVLDDVMRAVRDDGRNEDDVILLGDFNADHRHFGELGRMPQIAWAISDPTNTRQTKQYDNLVFFANATREFTGRAEVFDFMREYNLTIDQALEVSDHLPVWAEFSIYEGGEIGRVATLPTDRAR